MKLALLSTGCWGPGFSNAQELDNIFNQVEFEHHPTKSPAPGIIPPNERRRAPLPVKLAVESSWQATGQNDIDAKQLACVFTTTNGDTDITDNVCKALNTKDKLISPTKFHNSVHNAAVGYWTISTGCMCSASSCAGDTYSVSVTLLEACLQAVTNNQPVLVTFYEAPTCDILQPLMSNRDAFAASIVIAPDNHLLTQQHLPLAGFKLEINEIQSQWNELSTAQLALLYETCPTAKILALLEMISLKQSRPLVMPLSSGTSLSLNITV